MLEPEQSDNSPTISEAIMRRKRLTLFANNKQSTMGSSICDFLDKKSKKSEDNEPPPKTYQEMARRVILKNKKERA